MTNDEAGAMIAMLTDHFRCPVMPIDRYCAGLRAWQSALRERANRRLQELYPDWPSTDAITRYHEDRRNKTGPYVDHLLRDYESLSEHVDDVFRQITKSNLLARILYGGERVRTDMCPVHKGQWSGCVWGDGECPHCMSGSNVTGWVAP